LDVIINTSSSSVEFVKYGISLINNDLLEYGNLSLTLTDSCEYPLSFWYIIFSEYKLPSTYGLWSVYLTSLGDIGSIV